MPGKQAPWKRAPHSFRPLLGKSNNLRNYSKCGAGAIGFVRWRTMQGIRWMITAHPDYHDLVAAARARSPSDAVSAYQEWLTDEMSARSEDARLFMTNWQNFFTESTRLFSNFGSNGRMR